RPVADRPAKSCDGDPGRPAERPTRRVRAAAKRAPAGAGEQLGQGGAGGGDGGPGGLRLGHGDLPRRARGRDATGPAPASGPVGVAQGSQGRLPGDAEPIPGPADGGGGGAVRPGGGGGERGEVG